MEDPSLSKNMASLVYGPVHLLRLFVKLPDILSRMRLPPKTAKLIVKYVDHVIDYISKNSLELFGSE